MIKQEKYVDIVEDNVLSVKLDKVKLLYNLGVRSPLG